MNVHIEATAEMMGVAAARAGADKIRTALEAHGESFIILATGASQFEVLKALVQEPGIDWQNVTVFHLDEYAGLSMDHPASFRRYLKERFVDQLDTAVKAFHYISGEGDTAEECQRLAGIIQPVKIDVAFIGIGENCHIAFNDPPADFETEDPYIVVDLDEDCRKQQMGEGWFTDLEAVPERAISMSVKQTLKARSIICTVPDARKADAAQKAIEGPITPDAPSSILQTHADCKIFLDQASASALEREYGI